MGVYLRAEFEVSSIILQVLDRLEGAGGIILLPPPPPQKEPLKSPPTLGLRLNDYIAVLKVTFRT